MIREIDLYAVSNIEDRIAAQADRDDRNATPTQRAIRAIPQHQLTAKVALEILETLQSAFIASKNYDLDESIGALDDVLDPLYRIIERDKASDQEELSSAMRVYNPYHPD